MKHILLFLHFLLFFCSMNIFAGGDTSDGHTHAEAPPITSRQNLSPRTVASSEQFELVAVLDKEILTIYLDDYVTNKAITGAKIEISSNEINGLATEIAAGLYQLKLNKLTPGKHALTISLEAGETTDLLISTLDNSLAHNAGENKPQHFSRVNYIAAGSLLLAIFTLILFLRQRGKKGLR